MPTALQDYKTSPLGLVLSAFWCEDDTKFGEKTLYLDLTFGVRKLTNLVRERYKNWCESVDPEVIQNDPEVIQNDPEVIQNDPEVI